LKEAVWKLIDLIRVYLRHNKHVDEAPLAMEPGATIIDVATKVHKELGATCRGARMWGPSARFDDLLWKIFDEAIYHFLSPYWGFPTLFSAMQCILSLERPSCHHGSCTELSVRNVHD